MLNKIEQMKNEVQRRVEDAKQEAIHQEYSLLF